MTPSPSTAEYRWSSWVNAWTLVSLPGVCVSTLRWGPATAIGIAAAVAVPLALTLVLYRHGSGQWHVQGDSPHVARQDQHTAEFVRSGWIVRVVICAVALVIATSAIAGLIPGLTLPWVLACAATTPPTLDLLRRVIRPSRDTLVAQSEVPPAAPSRVSQFSASTHHARPEQTIRTMTDAELCRAWRRSFWTLREARYPTERFGIVEERQLILDELDARNAAAVQAWLKSGARPCGGLERFLAAGDDQSNSA